MVDKKPNTESELPRVDETEVNRVDETEKSEILRFLSQGEQSDETGADGLAEGTEKEEESSLAEKPGKEPGEESGQSKQESEEKEEDSFVSSSELPEELKPAYKNMQAAFTKAMQGIPKEYRGEKFKELLDKSKAWDEVESDPGLTKVVEDYLADKERSQKEGKPVRKSEPGLPKENEFDGLLSDATEIDKQFLKRYGPVFQKMVEKGLSPLAADIYAGREKQLYDKLQKQYGIDTESLKPKISGLLKEVPDMTHEEAFKIVAFENLLQKAKTDAKEEAEKEAKKREASFVAGGSKRSGESEAPDFKKMSLAEMSKNLPRASRE